MRQINQIIWIVLIGFLATYSEMPTTVTSPSEGNFSALDAEKHIHIMAGEVHFMGTASNRKVRDYILSEFAKMDIPTEIFVGHSSQAWGGYNRLGKTENIIATIKGQSSEKVVMVAGHYDSVLNSPGAADDVHAVANILVTAKLLKDSNPQNDIVFLITDGEEMGLFGAKAYAETKDVSNIGVLLNYEARGNSGPNISFEWSDGNGWLVRQLRKAVRKPIANSMSYEIYNQLPNDTDFTYFKKEGVPGINNAYIDGFSYYHNPVDNPENINMNSVQHAGENMYQLTKHFANTDLSNTVTKNASFFNFLGTLVIYPASLNVFFVILSILLIGFVLYEALSSKVLGPKSMFLGLITNIGIVVVSAGLAFGLSKLLFVIYPQYGLFYTGQFYNHKLYLYAAGGLTILVFWLLAKLFARKNDMIGLQAGGLLLLGFLNIAIYATLPTASYILVFPTIMLSLIFWYKNKYPNTKEYSIHSALVRLGSVVPFAIWIPVTATFFLAFSIAGLPGPVVFIGLIGIALTICNKALWTETNLMAYLGAAIFLISMIAGHLSSAPTADKPIPSSAYFLHNVDTGQSHMVSNDNNLNAGNQALLAGYEQIALNIPNAITRIAVPSNEQLQVTIPTVTVDSLNAGTLLINSEQEAYLTRLVFDNTTNITTATIDDQVVITDGDADKQFILDLYGFTSGSLSLTIVKKDSSIIQHIGIASRFESMPVDIVVDEARRVDGYTAVVREVEM